MSGNQNYSMKAFVSFRVTCRTGVKANKQTTITTTTTIKRKTINPSASKSPIQQSNKAADKLFWFGFSTREAKFGAGMIFPLSVVVTFVVPGARFNPEILRSLTGPKSYFETKMSGIVVWVLAL